MAFAKRRAPLTLLLLRDAQARVRRQGPVSSGVDEAQGFVPRDGRTAGVGRSIYQRVALRHGEVLFLHRNQHKLTGQRDERMEKPAEENSVVPASEALGAPQEDGYPDPVL
ncbi:hypothetical protein ON010_g6393 [Phytophthora cinnamomi]|nr:hypothetical protein ON010_g6393 [Phytophthora cinnamomi]